MEERKQIEIEHYDQKAKELGRGPASSNLASLKFVYKLLKEKCRGKLVLDYGCGNGVHTIAIAKTGVKKVIGIDLSEKSLEIARRAVPGAEFLKMDCEKMEFPDNYFDVIFDGGTFSSLDLKLALPELARVLKPDGVLIGVETFGHNPLTNLKRKLNKLTGKRTGWAAEHIFQEKDLKDAERYFNRIKINYFHLISWAALPFLKYPGGGIFLRFLELIDKFFLLFPFLRKYAFKVVFILEKR
ncbi:MAG: class I SAM-dependent methyltransferase [Patescibacteria group bacterium]